MLTEVQVQYKVEYLKDQLWDLLAFSHTNICLGFVLGLRNVLYIHLKGSRNVQKNTENIRPYFGT